MIVRVDYPGQWDDGRVYYLMRVGNGRIVLTSERKDAHVWESREEAIKVCSRMPAIARCVILAVGA